MCPLSSHTPSQSMCWLEDHGTKSHGHRPPDTATLLSEVLTYVTHLAVSHAKSNDTPCSPLTCL